MYGEFWEAPSWVWNPKVRVLEEVEMDAITVSFCCYPEGIVAKVLCLYRSEWGSFKILVEFSNSSGW